MGIYCRSWAAGPRPCSRAAFSSVKMCYASFCLPSPSLGTEQNEARTQGLNEFFSSINPNESSVLTFLIVEILNYLIAHHVKG
jgi:hypothetical protein